MKIINFQLGAAALNLPLDDVRPISNIDPQQIVNLVAGRYKFSVRPQPNQVSIRMPAGIPPAVAAAMMAAASGPGTPRQIQAQFILQNGMASIDERNISISRIEIARDMSSIAIHSTTTEEADSVLDDLIPVMETDLGFRLIKDFAKRTYTSGIVVQFDSDFDAAFTIVRTLQEIIGNKLKSATGVDQAAKLERLGFAFDPMVIPAAFGQVPGVVLERRVGSPFSENRYFCSAPMRTSDLVEVVEKIGALLESQK